MQHWNQEQDQKTQGWQRGLIWTLEAQVEGTAPLPLPPPPAHHCGELSLSLQTPKRVPQGLNLGRMEQEGAPCLLKAGKLGVLPVRMIEEI